MTTRQMQIDYEALKAAYISLEKKHEKLQKEHEELRKQYEKLEKYKYDPEYRRAQYVKHREKILAKQKEYDLAHKKEISQKAHERYLLQRQPH